MSDDPIIPDEVLQPGRQSDPGSQQAEGRSGLPDSDPGGGDGARGTSQRVRGKAPPGWREEFIRSLSLIPVVQAACQIAQVSRTHAYRVRGEDEEFRAAWDSALEDAIDRLETSAYKRATAGIERVTYRRDGSVASREMVFSDRMTELLLKRWRPELYRERFDIQTHNTSELDGEIMELAKRLGIQAEALGPGDTSDQSEGERERESEDEH